jgi:hypothetical protein
MVKLLLELLRDYIDGGFRRRRASNEDFTIVIYQIINRAKRELTRIDIFRIPKNDNEE